MVTQTGANIRYVFDGITVWARHVNIAVALGPTCPTEGDSGAPVYRKLSSSRIAAVGIWSGRAALVFECQAYFTDIWGAYYGLPGTIKTAN